MDKLSVESGRRRDLPAFGGRRSTRFELVSFFLNCLTSLNEANCESQSNDFAGVLFSRLRYHAPPAIFPGRVKAFPSL